MIMRFNLDLLGHAVLSMKKAELRRTIYFHGDLIPRHYVALLWFLVLGIGSKTDVDLGQDEQEQRVSSSV